MALQLRVILLAAAAAAAGIGSGAARADEVKVLAANAVKEPLLAIAAAFEKATGHKVSASWSGTEGITKRISGGEVVDIVVVGSASLQRLIQDGNLIADSRVSFAKVGVGVAVRAGLPKPDISSAEAVKKAVLDARSVAYSSGPSGQYIADLFKRLGIAEQVKNKLTLPPSNVLVGEVLARGEERYNIYCATCHDRTGQGHGIVSVRSSWLPSNLHDPRQKNMTDGELFWVATNGRRSMPAYRFQVDERDRWAIVAYVRALQRTTSATLNDVPAELKGDLR